VANTNFVALDPAFLVFGIGVNGIYAAHFFGTGTDDIFLDDIQVEIAAASVPEPATLPLLLTGLMSLLLLKKRRPPPCARSGP
jgi:hypothetical protein